MTDPRAQDALREMFRGVNERVGAVEAPDRPAADAVFERFGGDDSNVRALEEPDVRHEPVRDVLAWEDPWPVSYGVDASTTTPLQFSDGVLLSAANAKLGVKGNTDDPAVAHESTVSMSVYARDDDLDVGGLDGSGEHVERSVFRFPTLGGREDSLPGWTMSLARTFAEGAHARRLIERIDGPLFIDGPVYPSGIVLWTLFARNESAPRSPASDDICPARVVEILTNYVRVVEHHHREGYPVIGVTKQPSGSRTVGALEAGTEDAPLRWGNDHQFFSDALSTETDRQGDDGEIISYTTWLLQERMETYGESLVPFEEIDGLTLRRGDAEEYQRAFFYVRVPLRDVVLRVDAPLLMVRSQRDRERIRRKALAEIASMRDIPLAVKSADAAARISRENREELKKEMKNVVAQPSYNAEYRPQHYERGN